MSDRPSLRLTWLPRVGLLTATLVGSLAFGGGSFVAAAQDASPSPMGDCVPGTMSSKVIPAATPEASPAGEAAPVDEAVGTPADDATVEAVDAFFANFAACAGNPDALATLVTANFVNTNGGYASVEDALADDFFSEGVPTGIEVGDVTSFADGSIGVELTYQQGPYQIASEVWTLVQENGEWKLDSLSSGDTPEIDGDTVAVGVNLNEIEGGYEVVPNTASVVATDVLILQAINTSTNTEPHELAVLQLPEGVTPEDIFAGDVPEEDVTFIGGVFVPEPGESTDLVLVDLPPGIYYLACFVEGPDGAPHAMNGMITQFEVTAPEEVAPPTS
jgi:hypothetical protein